MYFTGTGLDHFWAVRCTIGIPLGGLLVSCYEILVYVQFAYSQSGYVYIDKRIP